MNTKKISAIIILSSVLLFSCSKEKSVVPQTPVKNYEGKWENQIPPVNTNPLDFININMVIAGGGTGTLDTKYISTGHLYPQTNLTWQKIAGDSVVMTLHFPAYPADTWELRGLANADNSKITTNCYYILNNDLSTKANYGTVVLNKK
jgi:hypothetical protein